VKRVVAAAAVLAAGAAWVGASLPPRPQTLVPRPDGTVRGIFHVHTSRSDGRGSPEEIAAIAARAGLQFIVFTDHGDGTRAPDAPVYRSGVLCLDGVEISTRGGHYIAVDMGAAPYPLGGEPRDVVEDVRRLGGFGIVAHPDSPTPELRWRDWTLPVDAVEIVNPDTSWRRLAFEGGWRPRLRLLNGLLTYPLRPVETMASLLADPSENVARWEALTRQRRVVGLAGADAHAKLSLVDLDPGDNAWSLPFPGYAPAFEMLSVHVRPASPPSGDAGADAAALMRGLRAGHVYVAVDGLATPPSFEMAAGPDGATGPGGEVAAGSPSALRIRSNAPPSFTTSVWRGSELVTQSTDAELTVPIPGDPAVYRVDIGALTGSTRAAWLFANPLYVRGPGQAPSYADPGSGVEVLPLFDGGERAAGWRTESGPSSAAQMDVVPAPSTGGGNAIRLRYQLGSDGASTQYAGVLMETEQPIAAADRVTFTARADRPMRISLQLRTAIHGAGPEERWQRSVYLDASERARVVRFDEMAAVGSTRTAKPALGEVRDIMFVVDTTNARPGQSGAIWIVRAALQRED
jgi:hypothetical protein